MGGCFNFSRVRGNRLLFSNQGDASSLAPGIELDPDRLDHPTDPFTERLAPQTLVNRAKKNLLSSSAVHGGVVDNNLAD